MKNLPFIFLILTFIGCNKHKEKPCDTSVDWNWDPNRNFGYLDSTDQLSFVHNSLDTIKLDKQTQQESSHKESHCGSNCMMAGACPTIYNFNVITTTFKKQQDYQLSISNDFALPMNNSDAPPSDIKVFQFNQFKATIEANPWSTNSPLPWKEYVVESNITIANKLYPYIYTFSSNKITLQLSNDLKILKYIDAVKMDTLVALFQ